MGLKIADLLRWRTSVDLKGPDGKPILDDNKKPVTVYLRVIGDDALQESYKVARIMSAQTRKKLRDKQSLEFKDQVEPIRDATKEECIELIKTARSQDFDALAYANTPRPDAVKLEEVAADPDAPTLEEQEQLDSENAEQDKKFAEALEEYKKTKIVELEEELNSKTVEELRDMAEIEVSNITSLGLFLQAVQDYKIINGCYNDKTYKERSFDSIEEYRATHPVIKEQLAEAYAKLERGTEDLKN